MEKMLHKLARQLDSLDEASLMALWSKYATLTSRFEPTRRWEDACLVFSLIQAKRWKNQLFNFSWSQQRQPPLKNRLDAANEIFNPDFNLEEDLMPEAKPAEKKPCRVLVFKLPVETEAEEAESEKAGADTPQLGIADTGVKETARAGSGVADDHAPEQSAADDHAPGVAAAMSNTPESGPNVDESDATKRRRAKPSVQEPVNGEEAAVEGSVADEPGGANVDKTSKNPDDRQ